MTLKPIQHYFFTALFRHIDSSLTFNSNMTLLLIRLQLILKMVLATTKPIGIKILNFVSERQL